VRAAAGPVFVEASDFAELSAAPLMGYELAHNLNLQHDSLEIANLLALFFPPGTVLTEKQVNNLPKPASADRPYWREIHSDYAVSDRGSYRTPTLLLLGGTLCVLLIVNAINRAWKPA